MKPYDMKMFNEDPTLKEEEEMEVVPTEQAQPLAQEEKEIPYASKLDPKEKELFIRTLGLVESSGGKDMNHKMMQGGIHKGTSAIGTYGLMPNTIQEFARRLKTPELQELAKLPYPEMKKRLEQDKELERKTFEPIADWMLNRFKDTRKANYAHQFGHNLSPERVEAEYKDSDRDLAFMSKYELAVKQLAEEEARKEQEALLAQQSKPAEDPSYINKIRSFFKK